MSKHRIKIYPSINIDELMLINQNYLKDAAQTVFHSNVMPTIHMPNLFTGTRKTIYYQNIKKGNVDTQEIKPIEFANYESKGSILKHKEVMTFEDCMEFLESNISISMNESNEDLLKKYLESAALPEDMVINVEFQKNNNKIILIKKDLKKKYGDYLTPYFDEKTPSCFNLNESSSIKKYTNVVFDNYNSHTYLQVEHYKELDVLVYTIINPDIDKIVPAITVTDMNKVPLEVHCYYKKDYINPELIKELKPNMLNEDFNADDYFNCRDLELLDMTRI